ncbi:MAG: hypothetical protein PVJ20_06190 [Desulfobacterales bacterium]
MNGDTETETDGRETSASLHVGINRCGSKYKRGTGCGKTERPGLFGGYRVTDITTTTPNKSI